MPTALTHAVSGLALGTPFRRSFRGSGVWMAGAVCAALPDLHVLGFPVGVRYADLLGHRGLTHSLPFALALASVAVLVVFREAPRAAVWSYLFVATASHGCLDAFTDGGLGVAFFSPLSNARYFFPVRPIRVSPIGLGAFLSHGGLAVVWSEARWVWVPCALFTTIVLGWQRAISRTTGG